MSLYCTLSSLLMIFHDFHFSFFCMLFYSLAKPCIFGQSVASKNTLSNTVAMFFLMIFFFFLNTQKKNSQKDFQKLFYFYFLLYVQNSSEKKGFVDLTTSSLVFHFFEINFFCCWFWCFLLEVGVSPKECTKNWLLLKRVELGNFLLHILIDLAKCHHSFLIKN